MLTTAPVTTTTDEAFAIHAELVEAQRAQRVAATTPTTTLAEMRAASQRYDSAYAAVHQLRCEEAEAA